MVDKVQKKLSGWKARTLSFVRRVTLEQASIMNLPNYVMQTSSVQLSIYDELNAYVRISFGVVASLSICAVWFCGTVFANQKRTVALGSVVSD